MNDFDDDEAAINAQLLASLYVLAIVLALAVAVVCGLLITQSPT